VTVARHDDTRAFFERYRVSLGEGDVDTLCAAYRLPLPVIRPDRVRMIEDRATLRDELRRIVDTWLWAGMTSVAIADFRDDGFDPGMHVVSLVWRPLDAQFAEITSVDVTYAVRRVNEGARIAAIIAHNEERRRSPLVGPQRGARPVGASAQE